MKQALPLLTALLLGTAAMAQNFQVLNSHKYRIFGTQDNAIGLQVTEVIFDGDSIFHFAPQWSIVYPYTADCYDPSISSWLGTHVRIAPDGVTQFYRIDGTVFTLHTQAETGQNWTAYESADGNLTLQAEVSGMAMETVLGEADMVKTISLQAYNANMVPISHLANEQEVKIGQNLGLITTPVLGSFPDPDLSMLYGSYTLAGIEQSHGMQNLTYRGIWDFEPGDELHIQTIANGSETTTRYQYADTYVERTDYPDSIVYQVERSTWMYSGPYGSNLEYTFLGVATQEQVVKADSLLDQLPFSPTLIMESNGEHSSGGYYLMGTFDGRSTKQYEVGHANMFVSYQVQGSGTCYSQGIDWNYCSFGGHARYIAGLGGPYFECFTALPHGNATSLLYYNKSGVTWGSPLSTNDNLQKKAIAIAIYPNPAWGDARLTLPEMVWPAQLRVIGMDGKIALTQVVTESNQSLQRGGISAGVYAVHLVDANGSVATGRIVWE